MSQLQVKPCCEEWWKSRNLEPSFIYANWFAHYQLCLGPNDIFQLGRSQVPPPALPQRPPFTWHLKWAKLPFNKLRRQLDFLPRRWDFMLDSPSPDGEGLHDWFNFRFSNPFLPQHFWVGDSETQSFGCHGRCVNNFCWTSPSFRNMTTNYRMLGCLTRKRRRSQLLGCKRWLLFCGAGSGKEFRSRNPAAFPSVVKNWTWNYFSIQNESSALQSGPLQLWLTLSI